MQRDFKNYDYLTISVKTAQLNEILECYSVLGWREVKRENDREYYDMKYIVLRRPHRIASKDRLQFLQVRMETDVNAISAINAKKHAKSYAAFSFIMFFALGLLALGLWFILAPNGSYDYLYGIVTCVASAILTATAAIIIAVTHKPEVEAANSKILQTLNSIQSLLEEARSLVFNDFADDAIEEEKSSALNPDYSRLPEAASDGEGNKREVV